MATIPDDVIEFLAGEIGQIPENVRLGLRAVETIGWRLVPREPNDWMKGAGENTVLKQHTRADIAIEELGQNGDPGKYCGSIATWQSMWDWSPKP